MLQKFKSLGLGEYEMKAYTTLLRYGALKGGEIAKKSGVPQGKVYLALHRLEEAGFVNVTQIKPQIFSPIKPEIAIHNAVHGKVQDLSEVGEELIQEIKSLEKPIKEEKIIERIQVLAGKKARYSINDYFFQNARNEIRYIYTYEERPYSFVRLIHETAQRGVKIRFITTLVNNQNRSWIKEDLKAGIEVHYLKIDEIRLQIMDQTEARITVINPKDKRDRVTIYFQHGEMAKHLARYFDSLWKKAKQIRQL